MVCIGEGDGRWEDLWVGGDDIMYCRAEWPRKLDTVKLDSWDGIYGRFRPVGPEDLELSLLNMTFLSSLALHAVSPYEHVRTARLL